MNEIHTVIKTHSGRITTKTGSLKELIEYFRYRLQVGHEFDSRIPLQPKTAEVLVDALNDACELTQSTLFEQDFYELAD